MRPSNDIGRHASRRVNCTGGVVSSPKMNEPILQRRILDPSPPHLCPKKVHGSRQGLQLHQHYSLGAGDDFISLILRAPRPRHEKRGTRDTHPALTPGWLTPETSFRLSPNCSTRFALYPGFALRKNKHYCVGPVWPDQRVSSRYGDGRETRIGTCRASASPLDSGVCDTKNPANICQRSNLETLLHTWRWSRALYMALDSPFLKL